MTDIDGLIKRLRLAAKTGKPGSWNMLATSELYDAANALESFKLDAERWRAFRSRDELPHLDYTHFQDEFREDADSIIDAARQQQG